MSSGKYNTRRARAEADTFVRRRSGSFARMG
jgi:hypothetical protein